MKKQPLIHVVAHPPKLGSPKQDLYCVLIHGSWHGAWVWEPLQNLLADEGYASLAPSLRGHGDQSAPDGEARSGGTVAWRPTLDDYADDVAHAVSEHLPPGAPFVLIAHSLAGRIVLHYLRQQERKGGPLPVGIVFLAAVPPWGVLLSTLRLLRDRRFTLSILHALWPFPRPMMQRVVGTPEAAHALFRHTVRATEGEKRAFHKRLGNEAIIGYGQTLLPTPRICRKVAKRLQENNIPVLVIGGENDPIISKTEAEQTARLYNTTACYTFPGLSHDLMQDEQKNEVTQCLVTWLNNVSAPREA